MTDPAARRRAAAVAGHVGDVATARALAVDDDASVRATAVAALARLGELDAITLTAALRDADPAVRRRAVELGARRPDVDLIALLDDRDDSVVETAAWACGERGPAGAEVVERLVTLAGSHRDALGRWRRRQAPAGAQDKPALSRSRSATS